MTDGHAGGPAPALAADRLGKRNGRHWGLRDVTFAVPAGSVARAFSGTGAALHAAAYWGQPDVARMLLEARADAVVSLPSRDDFLQITPLGSAAATTPGIPQPSDREDVVLALVALLLGHGAEVNARRKDGMTALHGAAWRGHAAVARALLGAGADPAITAASGPHAGQTAADTALGQGHLVLAAELDPR